MSAASSANSVAQNAARMLLARTAVQLLPIRLMCSPFVLFPADSEFIQWIDPDLDFATPPESLCVGLESKFLQSIAVERP